ncbi:formyltetrahydrofolate deformylase [Parafrankia sp. EUN1f]|uniref:formyltetrahydrofolate deformylase n=1 Tax=Parafrankia sp. EUN1f TaxID=102897 RepID=UPI0001C43D8F|nr:formyltetrahydrofolate deformylase [Parafrankia sp. EUN1f]EFC86009.1 formyltetrahydrofolate deformylase [Parafrankia sp. EUN1f]
MTAPAGAQHGVLLLSCPDTPGIVHAVAELLLQEKCTIVASHQFGSAATRTFYLRVEFAHIDGSRLDLDELRARIAPLGARFGMTWRLADTAHRTRTVIMASRFAHCLNDLLFRTSIGELNLDVVAVVSNHPDLGGIARHFDAPFRHLPVTPATRNEAEADLLDLVHAEQVDLVVLARYMQILSPRLCEHLAGRAINIHHSMLPSFKGAKPYHQAYARGVKFIGATAHYVTEDLDEGPIIEQELIRVDHTLDPDQLAARGREAETRALARAVRWHTENRIILSDGKTVILH